MADQNLGAWLDSSDDFTQNQSEVSVDAPTCDMKISELQGQVFAIYAKEPIDSAYEGSQKLTIRKTPDGKDISVFCSSKVVNSQLVRLADQISMPYLVKLVGVKRYLKLQLVGKD